MKRFKYLIFGFISLALLSCAAQRDIEPLESMRDLEYAWPTRYAELDDGMEIAYVDVGEGEHTIIFIHGLGSYLPAWRPNIRELSEDFRCIAIDLPGYGKSSKGNYEGSMSFFSNALIEFMAELDIDEAVLAGHSMGGQIAILTALAYPEKVDKLILSAPAGFEEFTVGEEEWFREVYSAELVIKTTVEQIKNNFFYNFYRFPDEAKFMIRDRIAMRSAEDFPEYAFIIPQSVRGMVDEPVYEYLPQVDQPTLVFFGEYDNLIPNRYLRGGETEVIARDGVSRMPNATLIMVDNAGHFVHFEKSEIFNETVREFLGKR